MYSPRPGTLAAATMVDDVPPEEKKRRLDAVNALQDEIATRINRRLLGQRVEILVEGRQKGKWKGRTRTNKLVFFSDESGRDWRGELVEVAITWSGPWSMQAQLVTERDKERAREAHIADSVASEVFSLPAHARCLKPLLFLHPICATPSYRRDDPHRGPEF
jgi:hypothetical protein